LSKSTPAETTAGKPTGAGKPKEVSDKKKAAPAKYKMTVPFFGRGIENFARDFLGCIIFPFVHLAMALMLFFDLCYSHLRKWFLTISRTRNLSVKERDAGKTGKMVIDSFFVEELDELDWKKIREEYIEEFVPFVLKSKTGKLSDYSPPECALAANFSAASIRVATCPLLDALPGLDGLIQHMFPWHLKAYWPLWFMGRYNQGYAHVDVGMGTQNCYFLRSGRKDVLLFPEDVSADMKLTVGVDGLFIPGSDDNEREYLDSIPRYYHVDLGPQEMLVFANSLLVHQFRNGGYHGIPEGEAPPTALSIRMRDGRVFDSRVAKALVVGVKSSWRFTQFFTNWVFGARIEDREAAYL
jgi:hypothetical protein